MHSKLIIKLLFRGNWAVMVILMIFRFMNVTAEKLEVQKIQTNMKCSICEEDYFDIQGILAHWRFVKKKCVFFLENFSIFVLHPAPHKWILAHL